MARGIYRWTPERIRALRTALECTQVQFSKLAHVAPSTVAMWETGHSTPSPRASRTLGQLQGLLPHNQRPAPEVGTYTLAELYEDRPQTHLILCEESPTYRAIALAEGAYVPPHLLT